jgi:hypothetical protein
MSNTEQDTREALAELVYLKDLKDWMCKSGSANESFRGRDFAAGEVVAEYKRRQPLAWERARAALQAREAPQPSDERAPLTQAIDALRAAREAPPEPLTDEQQAFEKWAAGKFPEWTLQDDGTGGYHNARAEYAWIGWQGRAALAREAPPSSGIPSVSGDQAHE